MPKGYPAHTTSPPIGDENTMPLVLAFLSLVASGGESGWNDGTLVEVTNCSVVIAGGSTSALAAAVASAKEGVRTCLLEPTE